MKKLVSVALAISTMVGGSAAFAGMSEDTTTVVGIQVAPITDAGTVYGWIRVESVPEVFPSACVQSNGSKNVYMPFVVSTDAGKALLSAAQSAFLAGKPVRVFYANGATPCLTNGSSKYAFINGIRVGN